MRGQLNCPQFGSPLALLNWWAPLFLLLFLHYCLFPFFWPALNWLQAAPFPRARAPIEACRPRSVQSNGRDARALRVAPVVFVFACARPSHNRQSQLGPDERNGRALSRARGRGPAVSIGASTCLGPIAAGLSITIGGCPQPWRPINQLHSRNMSTQPSICSFRCLQKSFHQRKRHTHAHTHPMAPTDTSILVLGNLIL